MMASDVRTNLPIYIEPGKDPGKKLDLTPAQRDEIRGIVQGWIDDPDLSFALWVHEEVIKVLDNEWITEGECHVLGSILEAEERWDLQAALEGREEWRGHG